MSITVEEIKSLVKQIAEGRAEYDAAKAVLSEQNAKLEEMEYKALSMLKEIGENSFKCDFGTISRTERWRVNLPTTPEDKEKLFKYLKEKGAENLLTVNSNSLNSFFKEEWEACKERDPEGALNFTLPGLQEPKLNETLSFRKK